MTRVDFCSRLNAVAIRSIIRGFILDDAWDKITNFPFFPRASVLSCFRYRNKSFTRASIIEHVPLEGNSTNSPTPLENAERRAEFVVSRTNRRYFSARNPVIRSGSFYGQTRLEMRFARNRGAAHSISYDDASPTLLSFDRSIPAPSFSEISRLAHFEKRILFEAKWRIVDAEDSPCSTFVSNATITFETCLLKGCVCREEVYTLITVTLTIQRCSPFRK